MYFCSDSSEESIEDDVWVSDCMGGGGSLSNAKLYGLIGSILGVVGGFIGFIPHVGVFGIASAGLVGFILVLLAVREVANVTGREEIFRYYLYALIIEVIAVAVVAVSFFAFLASVFTSLGFNEGYGPPFNHHISADMSVIYGILAWLILLFIVVFACLILSTYYIKKSYYAIAEEVGVDMFRTAGLLYFLGAILLIIIVGAIILFIARILEIIAWASLPEEPIRREKTPPPPPPPVL